MKNKKNEDNEKNDETNEENIKEDGIKNLKKNIPMIQSNVSSYEMENLKNNTELYSPIVTDENNNDENINDSNNNYNNEKNRLLCESHQSQISFINESKDEKEEKNPLSIFESKAEEDNENEISMNEIEEEEESNSDNEKEIDKELYYKKIRPKVQKKISRIVKAKAVSFTLDKKKKVDKFYASDFLNLNKNNKTPEKPKENEKELIRKNKKLEKQKRKTLQKNRILHNKIMSDILEKDKPEDKKEQIKEKEDTLFELDEFDEQKKNMISYGSIFKDLLKVNININQIVPNKKEELEKTNKSDENDPYSYLYDSYGFLRTNLSLTPDTNYQKDYSSKKISKVKPSKAKIVNFYDKVRATSSENTFHKYRNNSLLKRHRLCQEKPKDKDDKDDKGSDYKKRTFTSQFYNNKKDKIPKTTTYHSEKEKGNKSVNYFSKNKLSKNTFDAERSNITNVVNLNKTDNSNNANNNISNISNDKSFKLIKCKKLPRFSTEQIKLNKTEIPIPQKKKNLIRITNNSTRAAFDRNNFSRDKKDKENKKDKEKDKVKEKNSSKKKELKKKEKEKEKEKENKKGEKKEIKNKIISKSERDKKEMNDQLRNIAIKFRKENNLKMNELEKIKRNFKKKLISLTDDLSNDKENEETSDLFYYKGPVDIKNISLLNYKDTVIELENKMRKSGYEISKIKENKFKCNKNGKGFIIQIVKIQNEILYYLINNNISK